MITRSELNAINRMEATNTLATSVESYSFNIVGWKMEEIRKLDRKTRKLFTMERMHHPRADVDRMYLPRNYKGGRGLIQLEISYEIATTIDYIATRCPEVAKTEYLHRHDKAAPYLHWNICKELIINVEEERK